MKIPNDREDIITNIETYDQSMRNVLGLQRSVRETMLQTVSRTMGWVLVFREGRWIAGPTKFCASAAEMTPEMYDKNRKRKLDPNAASNLLEELFFGDEPDWGAAEVGDAHRGVKVLRSLAKSVGKELRADTRFYVLPGESIGDAERDEVGRLLGLIKDAKLSKDAIQNLVARIGK